MAEPQNPFADDEWRDNPFRRSSLFQEFKRSADSGDFSRLEGRGPHQHLVPRFILSNFALPVDRAQRVFQLDSRTGMTRQVSVRDAAARSNFFTLEDEEGRRHTRLEGQLSLIDEHSARALRQLLADPMSLPDGDRATLATMAAVLEYRTLGGNKRAQEAVHSAMQRELASQWVDPSQFASRLERREQGPVAFAEAERLRQRALKQLREGEIRFKDQRAVAFQAAFAAMYDHAIEVFALSWRLLRGEGFITSDRGLAMYDPTPPLPWSGNGILSSSCAETTIPLAHDACLLLTPTGDELLEVEEVSKRRVEEINLRTYGWTDRFIFGKSQETVQAIRRLAKGRPDRIVRPRPPAEALMLPVDPSDPSIADRNEARGWPRHLYGTEGSVSDYVVIRHGENVLDALEFVHRKSQERIERALTENPNLRPAGPGFFRTMVAPGRGIEWQFFPAPHAD